MIFRKVSQWAPCWCYWRQVVQHAILYCTLKVRSESCLGNSTSKLRSYRSAKRFQVHCVCILSHAWVHHSDIQGVGNAGQGWVPAGGPLSHWLGSTAAEALWPQCSPLTFNGTGRVTAWFAAHVLFKSSWSDCTSAASAANLPAALQHSACHRHNPVTGITMAGWLADCAALPWMARLTRPTESTAVPVMSQVPRRRRNTLENVQLKKNHVCN